MPRIAAKTLSIALALAVTAGAAPALANPGKLRVRSHGEFVNATRGSYCWAESGMGFCADSIYPLKTNGKLPVFGRDLVKFRTSKPARRVSVSLVRVQGNEFETLSWRGRAKRRNEHGTKWRLRLPSNLGGANVLDAFVRYPQGDADFWAGLKQG